MCEGEVAFSFLLVCFCTIIVENRQVQQSADGKRPSEKRNRQFARATVAVQRGVQGSDGATGRKQTDRDGLDRAGDGGIRTEVSTTTTTVRFYFYF